MCRNSRNTATARMVRGARRITWQGLFASDHSSAGNISSNGSPWPKPSSTALDVSVQARLLDLLRGLVREMGLSAIIVTHDLAVVRLLADRLMVMKGGYVVEQGLTDQVLDDPQHEYTQLLVSSVLQV